ncbi:MAG: MauE/DoxX family redox-associated membrane protein [Candidatus Zixiibacteriota bacterium]
MRILKNDWLLLIARLVLGGFFIYAAIDKIAHPADFAKIVHNYRILPGDLINIFALFLPWLELLCGIALVAGTYTLGASALLSGMLVMFLVAVSAAIARGIKIDCGCFSTSGDGAREVGMPLIYQDTALLLLGIWIWARGSGRWALSHFTSAAR